MIRRAVPDDIERLCMLELLLFPDNALSVAQMECELARHVCLVIGRPVVAYALVGWDGAVLDLLRLGVHPKAQRCGLGERLLVGAMGDRPMVLTVRKNNAPAIRLYRKYGFTVVGHFNEGASWAMRWDPAPAACPSR